MKIIKVPTPEVSAARTLIKSLSEFAKGKPSDIQVELYNAIDAIGRWLKDYERITK